MLKVAWLTCSKKSFNEIIVPNSQSAMLNCCFPWQSGRVPNGFWESADNRRSYLDWLGERLGIAQATDWYDIRNFHFSQNHGGTLLKEFYSSSVASAMREYSPDHEWIPWLFSKTPRGFWAEASNRRLYMEWLSRLLGITSDDEWYTVTKHDFIQNHGSALLGYFRGSILAAVREFHPEYEWKAWLFPKVPHGFWSIAENRKCFLTWLSRRLELKVASDWLSLERSELLAAGGGWLLTHHYGGSYKRLLSEVASLRVCGSV